MDFFSFCLNTLVIRKTYVLGKFPGSLRVYMAARADRASRQAKPACSTRLGRHVVNSALVKFVLCLLFRLFVDFVCPATKNVVAAPVAVMAWHYFHLF